MKTNGQVWIETVLYTLIGLVLIGLSLAFITPRINEAKDRALIEQTIGSLNAFDEKINVVLEGGPANVRYLDFAMKRGELYIDGDGDEIIFVIKDVTKPYTEPEKDVSVSGRVNARTEKEQKGHSVTLTISYVGITDIEYDEKNEIKKITAAAVPYKFEISNKGSNSNANNPQMRINILAR